MKKRASDFLATSPEKVTPARRYFQASKEDFEHIIRHNAERGLVPVVRQVNGRTVFSFYPRASCHGGRMAKLRGVMVEVFDI